MRGTVFRVLKRTPRIIFDAVCYGAQLPPLGGRTKNRLVFRLEERQMTTFLDAEQFAHFISSNLMTREQD
jgi:hypothetical protein